MDVAQGEETSTMMNLKVRSLPLKFKADGLKQGSRFGENVLIMELEQVQPDTGSAENARTHEID